MKCFVDVVVNTGLEGFNLVACILFNTEKDEYNRCKLGNTLDPPAELYTVQNGHIIVADDHIGDLFEGGPQAILSVFRFIYFEGGIF